MTKKRGVRPSPIDIFERSHAVATSTGEIEYVSRKAQKISDDYQRTLVENDQQGVVKPVSDVFYEVVGGHVKGQVYGLGQGADLYYTKSMSSAHSTATSQNPGRITELEQRIESLESVRRQMQL